MSGYQDADQQEVDAYVAERMAKYREDNIKRIEGNAEYRKKTLCADLERYKGMIEQCMKDLELLRSKIGKDMAEFRLGEANYEVSVRDYKAKQIVHEREKAIADKKARELAEWKSNT